MGELKDDFTKARALCKEWWDENTMVVKDIQTAYRGIGHRVNKQEAEIVDLWRGQERTADILDKAMNCIEGLDKTLKEVKASHEALQAKYDALVNRLKEKFSGEQS